MFKKREKKKRTDPEIDVISEMVQIMKDSYTKFNAGLEKIIEEINERK